MFYPMMMTGAGGAGGYATATALSAQSEAREASTNVELFKHDIDRLLMITEALWTLMKKEHGYTDDMLTKMIGEIDRRKITPEGVTLKSPPVNCPACHRPNMASRTFCLYCGNAIDGNPFAR